MKALKHQIIYFTIIATLLRLGYRLKGPWFVHKRTGSCIGEGQFVSINTFTEMLAYLRYRIAYHYEQ